MASLWLLMRVRRSGKPSWHHWGILQQEEVAQLLAKIILPHPSFTEEKR